MAISDEKFADHAKWMAFKRNSFSWPSAWRAVIIKLDKVIDPNTGETTYAVYPRNPEYDAYMDECDMKGFLMFGPETVPPMHLGAIMFDSMDDINNWAVVAARLSK